MFRTCVCLHNMLHEFDHRHEWGSGLRWGEPDGDPNDPNTNWAVPQVGHCYTVKLFRPHHDLCHMFRLPLPPSISGSWG